MLLLLLCLALRAFSLSQGLNPADKPESADQPNTLQTDLLSLSDGCSGLLKALHHNTTLDVSLGLLDDLDLNLLAHHVCERLSCGVFEHVETVEMQESGCLEGCILTDSKLTNCSRVTRGDCTNATKIICGRGVVRLVGGQDHCAGRVELLVAADWGTVCDDYFDLRSGNVVCAQLRCGTAKHVVSFGAGTGTIHITKMQCNGSEADLWDCGANNSISSNYCGRKEDAGVICSESKELMPVTPERVPVPQTSEKVAEHDGGSSAATVGCFILSVIVLLFIISNGAYFYFKRRKAESLIHQPRDDYNRIAVYTQCEPANSQSLGSKEKSTGSVASDIINPTQNIHMKSLQEEVVSDSETSSEEWYDNTEFDVESNRHYDEESPSFPEQTPHIPQVTGNAAGYGICRIFAAHEQDIKYSDSTSSDDCQQGEINEFGKPRETGNYFNNNDTGREPENLRAGSNNRSTCSHAHYGNVVLNTVSDSDSADETL